jgi:hypothetical protein
MLVAGTIASQFAGALGLMGAAIAVCGFVAHAGPALAGSGEKRLRDATVTGGLLGLGLAIFVIVLSALVS